MRDGECKAVTPSPAFFTIRSASLLPCLFVLIKNMLDLPVRLKENYNT